MEVRVWVGCLAHYNGGELIGEWVDATEAGDWVCPKRNPADIYINCEETWIMDHEIPGVSGEMSPMEAVAWGEVFADIEESDVEAFKLYVQFVEDDRGPAMVERFRHSYRGYFDSEKDFAYQLFDDFGIETEAEAHGCPKILLDHFDYEGWARELFMDGYHFYSGHVFEDVN